MYSLIHFKAIGTNKCDIFAKLISLEVFEQILPKTTIVKYVEPMLILHFFNFFVTRAYITYLMLLYVPCVFTSHPVNAPPVQNSECYT